MKAPSFAALRATINIEPLHLTLKAEAAKAWSWIRETTKTSYFKKRIAWLKATIPTLSSLHLLFVKKYRINPTPRRLRYEKRIGILEGNNWYANKL